MGSAKCTLVMFKGEGVSEGYLDGECNCEEEKIWSNSIAWTTREVMG